MRKGFTLIELLAVIVILAIIALIATPIILGIINDARSQANERSKENYISALKLAVVNYQLNNPDAELEGTCIAAADSLTCGSITVPIAVDNIVSVSGTITIVNGQVTGTENLTIVTGQGGSSGDNPTYAMIDSTATYDDYANGNDLLVFSSEADYSKFDHVEIDGQTVSSDDYTVTSGSTIVTFNIMYALSISTGTHTVKIVSTDGYASTTFEKTGVARAKIKFYINFSRLGGTVEEYEAVEGMTWAEWILATGGCSTDNGIAYVQDRTGDMYVGDLGNGYYVNGIVSQNGGNIENCSNAITSQTYGLNGPAL